LKTIRNVYSNGQLLFAIGLGNNSYVFIYKPAFFSKSMTEADGTADISTGQHPNHQCGLREDLCSASSGAETDQLSVFFIPKVKDQGAQAFSYGQGFCLL